MPDVELFENKEIKWRLTLPESYKIFLMKYNGAIPEKNVFKSEIREHYLERFLCILKSPQDSKLGMYDVSVVLTQIGERLTNNDILGADVLPIGAIFAGDMLCLDFRVYRENPSVCVWSHEESGILDPIMYKVADSFSNFLKMLE